jgi:hypothetical protein
MSATWPSEHVAKAEAQKILLQLEPASGDSKPIARRETLAGPGSDQLL